MSILTSEPDLFTKEEDIAINPNGYKGLAAFHKYWGKKPVEIIDYLISKLTTEGDIVIDPFLGGGLVAHIASQRRRRFIGIDINPIAIELGSLFVNMPSYIEYKKQLTKIENDVKKAIEQSYSYRGETASHYLWDEDRLEQVWIKKGKSIQTFNATNEDVKCLNDYISYMPRNIRELRFFQNSRINSKNEFNIKNLFTERALRNIDLLLDSIVKINDPILKRAFLLTLTSASGQMSNMVFAVSNRGKTKNLNNYAEKIEVGSWAIGFWCPKRHFEVNVWNCFIHRAKKLKKILTHDHYNKKDSLCTNIPEFINDKLDIALVCRSSLEALKEIPNNKISLIVTDPPHGDRMPYLELSEFWNAFLQIDIPDFKNEIVVSNAKERNKTLEEYNKDMSLFLKECYRVLSKDGLLVVFFNAKDSESWSFLEKAQQFEYIGCFPMNYSANSIVQDNRKGSMKSDYVLIYGKDKNEKVEVLKNMPLFNCNLPMKG